MNELISVIVPAFDTERYIGYCLDSIMRQTYRDLEIIVVDDGSRDSSGKIADGYAAADERIRVIHQDNLGLSAARNAGLAEAKGDFVLFIDSDDDILDTMIEELYDLMMRHDADIAICNFQEYPGNQAMDARVDQVYFRREWIRQNEDKFYEINDCYLPTVVQWNKLFRKKIFADLSFPQGRYHEDESVIHRQLYNAKRVAYTNRKLYRYYRHEGSITRTRLTGRCYDAMLGFADRIRFFREKDMYDLSAMTISRLNMFAGEVLEEYEGSDDYDTFMPKIERLLEDVNSSHRALNERGLEYERKAGLKRRMVNLARLLLSSINREAYLSRRLG